VIRIWVAATIVICRALFLEIIQNTTFGMGSFIGSGKKFKYMEKVIINPIKILLPYIGDQLDSCPDPRKEFFKIC
jgi:hypothetical protein